ncbi:hypothetical protein ACFQU2_10825 [Siccirubricoccus deserti]
MGRGAAPAKDAAEAGTGERPFSLVRWFAVLASVASPPPPSARRCC